MNNRNLSPSNNSLDSKQYKLNYFFPEFEKINNNPSNDNQRCYHKNGNLRVKIDRPVCPHCHNNKIYRNGSYSRKIKTPFYGTETFLIEKYVCKTCHKTFHADLSDKVSEKKTISHSVEHAVHELISHGINSVRDISELLESLFNVSVSHETVNQIILNENTRPKYNGFSDFSGYYMYDEEYVKINGEWMYLMVLYDDINHKIVNYEIYADKTKDTIKKFLEKSSRNIPRKAITTDLREDYSSIIEPLDYKHQLCHFHLSQDINKQIKTEKKNNDKEKDKTEKQLKKTTEKIDKLENKEKNKNKLTEKEQKELTKLKDKEKEQIEKINNLNNANDNIDDQKGELMDILRDNKYEIAVEQIEELKKKELEPIIVKLLNELIKPNLKRITNHKTDKDIEKTTSILENLFQKICQNMKKRL